MTIIESNRSSEEQFDLFCTADGFEGVLNHFNRLCGQLSINNTPTKHPWNIYKELRTQLRSYWKAAALFEKLDKRVQCSQYLHQTICNGVNAVVVGCGPCGLRCAIELALLGARVVVLEKRTTFSRNNVLHLWPYLIEDLRALGAKTFFGKFCAGSIDHISIRTMQCILLKTALLFGVQVFPGVTYQDLVEPTSDPSVESNMTTSITRVFIEQTGSDTVGSPLTVVNGQCVNGIHSQNGTHHVTLSKRKPAEIGVHGKVPNKTNSVASDVPLTVGWRMQLTPEIAVLKNYEIDVLIGADGKRSCLEFPSKELRCRLAIAITANFINYHTQAEAEVEEISGVASIFNQQFFARLASDTGVDLENIVYYKDETHYFVMTAKKHSLLAKGVLKQDREDSQSLLNAENIDHLALQAYARETANYVTNGRLPRLDFALNSHGQPDVDAFDFTRMFAAEYSCRIQEQKQHLLMQCLVGDGLFEPFWPTGSGCALGFLSAMDAAWAVSRLSCGLAPLQVIAQRESVYQRLSQTTAQNMPSNFVDYTLDPRTRYTRCNLNLFHAHQVRHLYITDRDKTSRSKSVQGSKKDVFDTVNGFTSNFLKETILSARTRYTTCTTLAPSDLGLLRWFQFRLSFYTVCGILDMPIDLSAAVWDAGIHLQCLIHLYRPELIPELEHLIQQGRDVDLCALFRRRTSSGLQPQPNLIRACGLLMEHFDVMFKAKHDPSATTYPKQNTDWAVYLTQVYQALRNLKFVEPKLTAATSRRESTRSAHPELSNGHNPKHKVLNRHPATHARSVHKRGGNRNNNYVIEQRDIAKGKAHVTTFGKRAFREDPNRAVEKGLLSKRRTELIATLRVWESSWRSPGQHCWDAQTNFNVDQAKELQVLMFWRRVFPPPGSPSVSYGSSNTLTTSGTLGRSSVGSATDGTAMGLDWVLGAVTYLRLEDFLGCQSSPLVLEMMPRGNVFMILKFTDPVLAKPAARLRRQNRLFSKRKGRDIPRSSEMNINVRLWARLLKSGQLLSLNRATMSGSATLNRPAEPGHLSSTTQTSTLMGHEGRYQAFDTPQRGAPASPTPSQVTISRTLLALPASRPSLHTHRVRTPSMSRLPTRLTSKQSGFSTLPVIGRSGKNLPIVRDRRHSLESASCRRLPVVQRTVSVVSRASSCQVCVCDRANRPVTMRI
ncbi:hypothetical protein P879_05770 [Paragonimus westermani]|uniref:[F-actin]-monooxygenase MICAL1-3-like Rossman domain-containing protein n=1 Tax=Paragonimus westermani TaxID=34504 RepID=A0A8T0DH62_9TREM|nr:hypothetical protein P879_05770 [Paragonimus westermani]